MKFLMVAAATALLAAPALAQDGSSPEALVLPGATLAPDCGNLYGLAGKAFCVSAPLAGIGTLADAYVEDLRAKGWIAVAGEDNRIVFVRRRDGGGCDGLQMQAFYDTSRPAGPTALGYIGFGPIPGDVCAAEPAATPAPQDQ